MSVTKQRVFISYAHVDRDYADALVQSLSTAGSSVWYDKKISVGDDWDDATQNALRSSSVVVLIVSPASLSSQYVNYEIGSAISAGIPVIPVLVGKVASLPYHLRNIQAIDAQGLDIVTIGAKVVAAVEELEGRNNDR